MSKTLNFFEDKVSIHLKNGVSTTSQKNKVRCFYLGEEDEKKLDTHFFCEQRDYEFKIDLKNDFPREDLKISIGDREVKFLWYEDKLRFTLDLKNEIGRSVLKIKNGEERIFELHFEIFTEKIDHQKDYQTIKDDLEKIERGIFFSHMGDAFNVLGFRSENPFVWEWWQVLMKNFKDFMQSLQMIETMPHKKIRKEYEICKAEKAKRIDKKSLDWSLKSNNFNEGRPIKTLNVRNEVTFNTYPNLYIKYVLEDVYKKMRGLLRAYERVNLKEDIKAYNEKEIKIIKEKRIEEIKTTLKKIKSMLNADYLKEVGKLKNPNVFSHKIYYDPNYRRIKKIHTLLNKSLIDAQNQVKMNFLEISIMYEMWCYFRICKILMRLSKNKIEFNYEGETINRLKQETKIFDLGYGHSIRFAYEEIISAQNEEEGKENFSVNLQRNPDFILEYQIDGKTVTSLVLDAKYYSENNIDTFLQAMSIYKAQVYHNYKNTSGAYAIVPFESKENFKYKNGLKYGIGYLPLRPNSADKTLEDYLKQFVLKASASEIVRKLQKEGYEAYFVGGAVRDLLFGEENKDYDIVTSAKPDEILEIFPEGKEVGKRFGVINISVGNHNFEIATFRKDVDYRKGKLQKISFAKNIEEDSARRDFTINAIYYDPIENKYLDPAGGKADLEKRLINFVGDAEERIKEDPLRILRYVRFKFKYDLSSSAQVEDKIKKHVTKLKQISAEAIKEELDKIMKIKSKLPEIFSAFENLNILHIILPELKNLQKIKAILNLAQDESEEIIWAIILHEVENHKEVLKRLKFKLKTADKISWLIRNQKFFDDFVEKSDEEKIQSLIDKKYQYDDRFDDLMSFYFIKEDVSLFEDSDLKKEQGAKRGKVNNDFKKIKDMILKKPDPTILINGNDIIEITKSDKDVGKKLENVWSEIFWKEIKDKKQALDLIKK